MVAETFENLAGMKSKMGPGELIIRLKEAKHLRGHDFMCLGKADMYAVFSLGGETRKSKVIHNGGTSPVWNEQLSFKLAPYVKFELYNTLNVLLYDEDLARDDAQGTVKIDIDTLLHESENEVPSRIYPVYYKGKQRGTVAIAFSFIPNLRKKTLDHCLASEN